MRNWLRRIAFAAGAGVVGLWLLALLSALATGAGGPIDLAFGPLLAAVPVAAVVAMVSVPWRATRRRTRGDWVVSGGGESTPPGRARPPTDRRR